MEKIKSYLDLGKKEGAKVLTGGSEAKLNSGLEKGNYIQPTIFEGNNKNANIPRGNFWTSSFGY